MSLKRNVSCNSVIFVIHSDGVIFAYYVHGKHLAPKFIQISKLNDDENTIEAISDVFMSSIAQFISILSFISSQFFH